jgi:5-methylcytosine-specific restriction protein A
MPVHSFVVGQVYSRRKDIHAVYGGQSQSGISTPAAYPLIFLITGESGATYGYSDRFTEDGAYWYTGEGQVGLSALVVDNKGGLHGRAGPGEASLQVQLTW